MSPPATSRSIALLAHPLLRNITAGVGSAVSNALITALSVPIFLHHLGLARYGLWATLSMIVTLTQLSTFGVGPALTTRVSELHGKGDERGVCSCVQAAHFATLLVSALMGLGFVLATPLVLSWFGIDSTLRREASALIPWIALLSAVSLTAQLVNSTLTGLGRADRASIQLSVGKLIGTVASVLGLWQGLGLTALPLGGVIGAVVQIIWGELVLRYSLRVRWGVRERADWSSLRPLLGLGSSVATGSLLQLFLTPFNKWLLARFAGLETVSIFEIGWSVATQVRALAATGLYPLVPEFARAREDNVRTSRLLRRSYALALGACTPVFAIAYWILPAALPLWLGARFTPELVLPARILMGATWIGTMGIPGYYRLLGEARGRELVLSQVVQSGTNLILGIVLVLVGLISPVSVALAVGVAVLAATLFLVLASYRSVNGVALELRHS